MVQHLSKCVISFILSPFLQTETRYPNPQKTHSFIVLIYTSRTSDVNVKSRLLSDYNHLHVGVQ